MSLFLKIFLWFWLALILVVATVIPLEGDLTNPRTNILAVIGNILQNAFVRSITASSSDMG